MAYEAEFRKMVKFHDLTFMYSDSGEVHRRGYAALEKVEKFAKEFLPREKAVEIWNSVVDEKIADGHRSSFYWKV